jgi:hypothetical protein
LLSQQRGLEAIRLEVEVEAFGVIVDVPEVDISGWLSIDRMINDWSIPRNGFELSHTSPTAIFGNDIYSFWEITSGQGRRLKFDTNFTLLRQENYYLFNGTGLMRGGFPSGSFINSIIYENNTWVIAGFNDDGAHNLMYGPTLDNLVGNLQFTQARYAYINSVNYLNNIWIVCGWANQVNNVFYGSNLASLTPLAIFGIGGTAKMAAYDNNTWVIVGQDKSGSGNNVYYGSSLASLTPLPIFGNGGQAYFATYANNTWVIVGYNISTSGINVYYGSSLASLTPLSLFGNGGTARSALYANNTWVIVGDDKSGSGNNVYYGSNLASLTPLPIFGNTGSARGVFYLDSKWVICGKDTSGSGRNVYYGSSLTSLTAIPLFGNGGYAEKAVYQNDTLVMCGKDVSGSNNHIWYYTLWSTQ